MAGYVLSPFVGTSFGKCCQSARVQAADGIRPRRSFLLPGTSRKISRSRRDFVCISSGPQHTECSIAFFPGCEHFARRIGTAPLRESAASDL